LESRVTSSSKKLADELEEKESIIRRLKKDLKEQERAAQTIADSASSQMSQMNQMQGAPSDSMALRGYEACFSSMRDVEILTLALTVMLILLGLL